MMKRVFATALVCSASSLVFLPLSARQQQAEAPRQSPGSSTSGILVELFTSEGCSSCPPADELLRRLDAQRSASTKQIVVLSEHVDYWDRTGWRDRFSSHEYTDRQEEYARRFGILGPYTPQIVVDGKHEFVGNNPHLLEAALRSADTQPKALLSISAADLDGNDLIVELEASALPPGNKHGDLYIALADNSDETQVKSGENSGRQLRHVAVLRSLQKVGKVGSEGVRKEFKLRVPKDLTKDNLRVVAFVQGPGSGTVLGSTLRILGEKVATR